MTMLTDALATKSATDYLAALGRVFVHGFTGTVPSTAAALSGALTPAITFKAGAVNVDDGKYGFTWATPSALSRVLTLNNVSLNGRGTGLSTGILTYIVIANQDDTLTADTSKYRLMMMVGTSGASDELIVVSDPSVSVGVVKPFLDALTLSF
jgi:hypothetical protein